MAGDIRYLTTGAGDGVRHIHVTTVPDLRPVRYSTWGIPTGAGWWLGPGKWNVIAWFILNPTWWSAVAFAFSVHVV
jgi:hypothetical protein